jgi:hypothetical protein
MNEDTCRAGVEAALFGFYQRASRGEVKPERQRKAARAKSPDAPPTEYAEQCKLARWLDLAVGTCGWCHVPNEQPGARDARQRAIAGARLRAAGRKSGVPDVLIFLPAPAALFRGVALELKRETGGRVSPNQVEWHRSLTDAGWRVLVARGADDAIRQLQTLGYGARKAME